MRILVDIRFDGVVEVEVPNHLSASEQTVFASKLALAQVVATSSNPDCGEALESACEEFIEETTGAEDDFDNSKVLGILGGWTLRE